MRTPQNHEKVAEILRSDAVRWRALEMVADLGLPDCWIAAGFVRNAVWDALHNRDPQHLVGDVDIIFFDPVRPEENRDRSVEDLLRLRDQTMDWSVKNQARMHHRNGDAPYTSACHAMRYWPETATAVAARLDANGKCVVRSAFGLDDLMDMIVRPTERFRGDKHPIFQARVSEKRWFETWPRLRLADD